MAISLDDAAKALSFVRGCGCCSVYAALDGLVPCSPKCGDADEYGDRDHTYSDGCNRDHASASRALLQAVADDARKDALTDLQERLRGARKRLRLMAGEAGYDNRRVRLFGKAAGTHLALSYIEEALR